MDNMMTEKELKDILAEKGIQINAIDESLKCMVDNALQNGMDFEDNVKRVLIMGPDYKFISYANTICERLSMHFKDRNITFLAAVIKRDGNKKHYMYGRLDSLLHPSDEYIIFDFLLEDEVEIIKVVSGIIIKKIHSSLCLLDSGNNDSKTLNIENFYPLFIIESEI